MKRLGNLFEQVASLPNLWAAWQDFQRGKRTRASVRAFNLDADRHVARLDRRLTAGSWRPGGYRLLLIREPKRRLIAAAPVRDRVVHHAVHRVLAPRLDGGLVDQTYACLPGRGSHLAVLALVAALRRHRYLLCLDIRHYFLSIDHAVLMHLMRRRLKDRRLLELLGVIAVSGAGLYRRPGVAELLELPSGFPPPGAGLPIGNLTSQWWGNHYLSGLDHFVKRQLRIPHYQRYMDDLTLLADSRSQLEEARQAVGEWLWEERRLRLKRPGAPVRPSAEGLTYLGYRVSPAGARPAAGVLRRMRQRVGEVVREGDEERIERSLASYRGVIGFVDLGRGGGPG